MSELLDAEAQEMLAAGLQLEQELDRMLSSFAYEHGALIRKACRIAPEQVDLGPVVATTLFGHLVSRMRKAHGREQTERLARTLLDQFDQAEAWAAERRAGETPPTKERMH